MGVCRNEFEFENTLYRVKVKKIARKEPRDRKRKVSRKRNRERESLFLKKARGGEKRTTSRAASNLT